jgi:hypothetical protein
MFGGADLMAEESFVYYNDVWTLNKNNQWANVTEVEQPTTLTQTSYSVPGFQPAEVIAGFTIAAVILLLVKRERIA